MAFVRPMARKLLNLIAAFVVQSRSSVFCRGEAGRDYSTNPAPLRLESTVQQKKIPMEFEKRDAA